MPPFALDACAMIAFLRGETGHEVVRELLCRQPPACLAHAVNVCEVFYNFLSAEDEAAARGAVGDLRTLGLSVREDMDESFWQTVARYRLACKMPLGDAFALSIAIRFQATLVTSDRKHFGPIAASGICKVLFIR